MKQWVEDLPIIFLYFVIGSFFLMVAGFLFYASVYESPGLEIKKYKDGYEIYKNGKLEFEFTRENTDSMSLETLKWIYEGD